MSETSHSDIHPARMVTIDLHSENQRLDNFLMAQFRQLPRSRIYQMIRKGEVRINRSRAKATSRLHAGDIVRLPPVHLLKTENIDIPLHEQKQIINRILFEDDALIILNKPSGMAVHKGSQIPYGAIDIMRIARPELEFIELVHRLDRSTSGLLLFAKDGQTLRELQSLTIHKYYELIVAGQWPYKDLHIEKSSLDTENRINGERHVIVSKQGKEAETHFEFINSHRHASHLKARLVTGRTHQIRVHAAYLGHPIIGDIRYATPEYCQQWTQKGIHRLLLHASQLQFTFHDKRYDITSEIPLEIIQIFNECIEL